MRKPGDRAGLWSRVSKAELNELREVQAGAMAGCGPECGVSIGGQF